MNFLAGAPLVVATTEIGLPVVVVFSNVRLPDVFIVANPAGDTDHFTPGTVTLDGFTVAVKDGLDAVNDTVPVALVDVPVAIVTVDELKLIDDGTTFVILIAYTAKIVGSVDNDALIVELPAFTPVTTPSEATVANKGVFDDHTILSLLFATDAANDKVLLTNNVLTATVGVVAIVIFGLAAILIVKFCLIVTEGLL